MVRPGFDGGCSVIICCYTGERWDLLSAGIEAAAGQLTGDDELIVVVDHNPELMDRVVTEHGRIALVVENAHDRGLSGARNTGVERAERTVVAFLDDDALPAPDWLARLTEVFADSEVVGVGGHAEPAWPDGDRPMWIPEEFLWVVGCSYRGQPETTAPVRNPIGCNMAFRRVAIDSVGGFSTSLGRVGKKPVGGEETDLSIRIRSSTGKTVLYKPDAGVTHSVTRERTSVRYFASRCYFEGRSKAILARRVGATDATSAERSYLTTLASGVSMRLRQAVRERTWHPLAQIAMLGFGLGLTTTGFVVGTVLSYLRRGT